MLKQSAVEMDYLSNLSNDTAFERAAEAGLDVVVPDEYTLTVDYDAPVIDTAFFETLEILQKFYPVEIEKTLRSKSGNYHIYLRSTEPLTDLEKVALQAILGSDPKRELFSFVRVKEGGLGYPSILFEKKVTDAPAQEYVPLPSLFGEENDEAIF